MGWDGPCKARLTLGILATVQLFSWVVQGLLYCPLQACRAAQLQAAAACKCREHGYRSGPHLPERETNAYVGPISLEPSTCLASLPRGKKPPAPGQDPGNPPASSKSKTWMGATVIPLFSKSGFICICFARRPLLSVFQRQSEPKSQAPTSLLLPIARQTRPMRQHHQITRC